MGWFWIWLLFVFFLLLLPLGYGWGYRGWGPPYPTYMRRRRTDIDAAGPPAGGSSSLGEPGRGMGTEEDFGWGWVADALWIVLIIAVVWFIVALSFLPAR